MAAKKPAATAPAKKPRMATSAAAKKPVRRASAGPVLRATRRDIAALRKLDADLADSALAAIAVALAKEIDVAKSGTLRSMCARELREVLSELRALTPAQKENDDLDVIRASRAERRANAAAR